MKINGYEKLLLEPQREMSLGTSSGVLNIYSVVEQNTFDDHSEYLTLMKEWNVPAYTYGHGFVYVISMTVDVEYTYGAIVWRGQKDWFAMIGLRNLTDSQKSLLRPGQENPNMNKIPNDKIISVGDMYMWLTNKVFMLHLDIWEGYS